MSQLVREKVDNRVERSIIMNSITSTDYLSRISRLMLPEYFVTPFAKTVYGWASEYYEQFKKAPGKDIQELYILHKARLESSEIDLISTFLTSLSEEYDKTLDNIDFAIKQATDWASFRSLTIARDKINQSLETRDFFQGEQAIANFKKVKEFNQNSVDALTDMKAVSRAFDHDEQFLFRFPGDAGELIGNIIRTDFVAFLGFAKAGKSWNLLDSAREAQKAGNNVLFVSLEMPQDQVLRRLWQPIAGKPKYTKDIKIPYFYKDEDDDEKYHIGEEWTRMEGFDPTQEDLLKLKQDYHRYHPTGSIRVACFPSMSVTVDDLRTFVDNLSFYDDFVPDVIVIDYADLLLSKTKAEKRHQLSEIWATLRGWALASRIAIVSASQAGRAASNADATEETIAEDISKIAHVTKMVAISSTKEERSKGVRRLSMLATRDEEAIYDQVYILSCLELGVFILDSKFRSELVAKKEKEK